MNPTRTLPPLPLGALGLLVLLFGVGFGAVSNASSPVPMGTAGVQLHALPIHGPVLSHAATQPVPVEDIDALLKYVKEFKDRSDPNVFKRIAAHGSEESFKALVKAVGYLKQGRGLNAAYGSFSAYRNSGELQDKSLEFLYRTARKHKREEHQRAATRALAKFGGAGHGSLRAVVDSHPDEAVRSLAVQPLLEFLAAENSREAAELIVRNCGLRLPGERLGVEQALDKIDGPGINQAFVLFVDDRRLALEKRLLVLEVLAEREDPLVDELIVDLMNDKQNQLLLRAVELAGIRKTTEARLHLVRLANEKNDPVTRAAILSLGLLHGKQAAWQEDLFAYSTSRRSAQRMGAAAALGLLRNDTALGHLHGLLGDKDRKVRIEALQSTGNLRRRESVPELIARLRVERGLLRENIATVLRLFSGLDLGNRPEPWQRWWSTSGQAAPLPSYEDALAKEKERNRRRSSNLSQASFYGLKVVSDRVVFVMDVSGSMAEAARGRRDRTSSNSKGGSTRLAVAQDELRRVLETFTNGGMFNLVFFSNGVDSWLDELEEMDDRARKDATEFLMRQRADGGTAVYDALERAFEDPDIDTIYLLSDGDPSVGKVIDPGLIRHEVQQWNAVRKIQINTVSIGQRSRLLRWLAEDSGGKHIEVL